MEWTSTGDPGLQSEVTWNGCILLIPVCVVFCSPISDQEKAIIRNTLIQNIEESVSQVCVCLSSFTFQQPGHLLHYVTFKFEEKQCQAVGN